LFERKGLRKEKIVTKLYHKLSLVLNTSEKKAPLKRSLSPLFNNGKLAGLFAVFTGVNVIDINAV